MVRKKKIINVVRFILMTTLFKKVLLIVLSNISD